MNLGQARTVPEAVLHGKEEILVHRSVKTRMDTKKLNYIPKVDLQKLKHKFVDY